MTPEMLAAGEFPTSAYRVIGSWGWCGHPFVSLRSWQCEVCGRRADERIRRYVSSTPAEAPPGFVWMLTLGTQDDGAEDGHRDDRVLGVYSNRRRIGAALVRTRWFGASDLREALDRTHWYQGVYNRWLFEGWVEGDVAEYRETRYCRVELEMIDGPGECVGDDVDRPALLLAATA